jgi:hypothetical protein
MSVRLDVRSNIDRVVVDFRAQREQVATATYRALNRALDKSSTESSREIRKVYNLKDRAVKASLKKVRANKNRLWAQLRIEGARIGLIEFDARWRPGQKIGATVRVKRASGRQAIEGAFIGTRRWNSWQDGGEHAHRGVFKRVGKARYPIRYLRSISIPQAFSNRAVVAAVQAIAIATFDKNFTQQLTYLSGATNG